MLMVCIRFNYTCVLFVSLLILKVFVYRVTIGRQVEYWNGAAQHTSEPIRLSYAVYLISPFVMIENLDLRKS